jgi:hypothetical protein
MTNRDFQLSVRYAGKAGKPVIVDAYDFGMSIAGASQVLQQSIALSGHGERALEIRPLVVGVRPGSILVDLALAAKDYGPTLLPLAPDMIRMGGDAYSTIKGLIEFLIALKGEKPKKQKHRQDGLVNVQVEGSNNTIIVSPTVIIAHGDKTVRRGLGRLVKPLMSGESPIESIGLATSKSKHVSISPSEAIYLSDAFDFQHAGEAKLRGVVRKIDRKTCAGYLTIDSRRVSFTYPQRFPQAKLDVLINSLRTLQPIIMTGEVSIDLQGHPRLIEVRDVIPDPGLFD